MYTPSFQGGREVTWLRPWTLEHRPDIRLNQSFPTNQHCGFLRGLLILSEPCLSNIRCR